MKKLILIDSNALVHRAFHALPLLTSPKGVPTNAVYGFSTILMRMLKELKPDYIVAAFDLAGPTFRHEAYEKYKAQRERAPDELYAQIPVAKDVLKAFGIPVIEQKGYEADDVIGTLAEQARKQKDLQTIIVTGDLDALQLVQGERVMVFTLRKGIGDTVIYDASAVQERFGLSPGQMTDFKGLKGDPSDNIPGVKGIGEKTASVLIKEFGSLEKLYAALDARIAADKGAKKAASSLTDSVAAKLTEHRDMAFFSKELATIVRTVPVTLDLDAAQWREHFNRTSLEGQFRDLGFYALVKRLGEVTPVVKAPRALPLETAPAGDISINETKSLGAISGMVALFPTDDSLSIATDDHSVRLVPATPQILEQVFSSASVALGHDLKPLIKHLSDSGVAYERELFDTRIAAWLAAPDLRQYGLEQVLYETENRLPDPDPRTHAAEIYRLRPLLWEKLKSLGLMKVFSDIEMPLVPVLADMERTGIRIDTDLLGDLLEEASREVKTLEQKIYDLAGGEFNINSPQQLGQILFEKLLLRGKIRRTGGGALSTAASELEKLRDEHPIVEFILQYRELNKLVTTYIEPFPSMVGADGRVHTTYNQTGTATGRLSSQDPNLQNIPIRTGLGQRFRRAFIADTGYSLLSLDYSQLELRLVAHVAKDQGMIAAFRKGEDIHTRTAVQIFKVPAADVTKDMRRQAKVLNFGIIYGMGVMGFARAAGIDRETARRFIDAYFMEFPGVAAYMARTKEEAADKGYVSTIFGRRRPLPDIASRMPQVAAAAERMAINHPIQGTGADIVKMAMVSVSKHIREHRKNDSARILLQVHDELVLEVRTQDVPRVAEEVREIMEKVHALDVPLVVDAKWGANWADMEVLRP